MYTDFTQALALVACLLLPSVTHATSISAEADLDAEFDVL